MVFAPRFLEGYRLAGGAAKYPEARRLIAALDNPTDKREFISAENTDPSSPARWSQIAVGCEFQRKYRRAGKHANLVTQDGTPDRNFLNQPGRRIVHHHNSIG
jgi:hypothetical protein